MTEIVEALLRAELKRHGDRWCKAVAALAEEKKIELLGKLMARRAISEARDNAAQRKPEPEERHYTSDMFCGTLNHGTGGGTRVIRKGAPFS